MRYSTVGSIVICLLSMLAVSLDATAQPAGKVRRLGILGTGAAPSAADPQQASFLQALHELGWVEGHNITVERRYAEGHSDRLPALAGALVHLGVEIIVAFGTPAAQAAKQATTTIPIVMWGASYPVETGLVASLARPGGNLTGIAAFGPEIHGKRLEILKEAVPALSRVGILWDPDNPGAVVGWQQAQVDAQALGITVLSFEVPQSSTLAQLFTALTQERPDALYVFPNPFPTAHRTEIAAFAAKNGLPTMGSAAFVQAGGLLAYATLREGPRRVVAYVDKILKGAKPADLPIERPTTFELIINLKTAKALGLTMPATLLFQAVEVIQ